tara:strand:- start:6556 stop:8742 length:2187 start_codon:yes stop_codon:yes gene_type:complete
MEFSKGTDFVTIDASSIDISGDEQIRITTTSIDICNNYTISFEELAFLNGVTENIQKQFNSGIWKQKPKPGGVINDVYLNNNAREDSGSGVAGLGFVGIGTDTPLAKFHLAAGNNSGGMLFQPNVSASQSGGRIFFKEDQDSSKNGFSIGYNGGEGDFSLNWPDRTFCFSGHNDDELGVNHITVQRDNGFVGLGVPEPQTRLHLDGDITLNGSIDMSGLIALGGATTVPGSETSLDISGDMAILPAIEGQGLNLGTKESGSDLYWKIAHKKFDDNSHDRSGLYFSRYESGVLNKFNTIVLRDSGMVGIGLSRPTSTLHVFQKSTDSKDIAFTVESNDANRLTEFKFYDDSTAVSQIYGFIDKNTTSGNNHLGLIYGVENSNHHISFQVSTTTNAEGDEKENYAMTIGYNSINISSQLKIINNDITATSYPLEITRAYWPATVNGNDMAVYGGVIYSTAFRYSDFHNHNQNTFTRNTEQNMEVFPGVAPISIKTRGSIWITGGHSNETATQKVGIYISSDERIKTDIENVPDNLALEMIENIETKYYHYKDPKCREHVKTIGFIAQNVKEHIPSAVSIQPNIIPDEIRMLDNLDWTECIDVSGNLKWKLTIPDLDLSANNTGICKFYMYDDISGNNGEEESCDITVESDMKSFIFDKKWNHIYFYGKEVNDFHTIRKEMIFTIHHSAIQELSKIKTQQADKIISLETENSQLKTRLDAIEALLAKHNIN